MISTRSLLLGTAVAVSLSAVPCAAQVDWVAARALEAPLATGRLAAADFDRDGRLDLAVHVTDSSGPAIHVFFDRDGSFQRPEIRRIGVGLAGADLFATDLDGDGNPDLVRHRGSVTALFGDGGGGFGQETTLLLEGLNRIAFLDADGDGCTDIAATDPTTRSVRVALQTAHEPRRFEWFSEAPVPAFAIVAADFDGDGNIDVAVGGSSQPITFLRGDGEGRFAVGAALDTGFRPSELVIAEVGGGPLPDIVGFSFGGALQTAVGSPDEGLTLGPTTPATSIRGRVAAVDVDGDGLTEIIGPAESGVVVLRCRKGGTFDAPRSWIGGRNAHSILADDLAGDGFVDVATASFEGRGGVHVFLGRPGADFAATTSQVLPSAGTSTAASDFDGDGNADVAVGTHSETNELVVAFGDGRGGFRDFVEAGPAGPIELVAAGDVTGDGLSDVVSVRFGTLTVSVGARTAFSPAGTAPAPIATTGLTLADTDGDGILNVILVGAESPPVASVLTVDAAGAFIARVDVALPLFASGIAAGDVNRDGATDLVIPISAPGIVLLALGTGAGGFGAPTPLAAFASAPGSLALADLNGDTLLDIVVGDTVTPTIEVALATGAGTYGFTRIFGTGFAETRVQVAEMTGDGMPDVIGLQASSHRFVILPGDGSGGFGTRIGLAAGFQSVSLAPDFTVADLDRDGRADLVSPTDDGVAIVTARRSAVGDALRGTVGLGAAGRADVLFVNESIGDGERLLSLGSGEAFTLSVAAAPAAASSRFALYVWPLGPDVGTIRRLPLGLGTVAFPVPLTGGAPQPRVIFNNAGHAPALGAATLPSSPAPATVIDRPGGIGRARTFTVQGIMADPGALNGRAAVTNGIVVISR